MRLGSMRDGSGVWASWGHFTLIAERSGESREMRKGCLTAFPKAVRRRFYRGLRRSGLLHRAGCNSEGSATAMAVCLGPTPVPVLIPGPTDD